MTVKHVLAPTCESVFKSINRAIMEYPEYEFDSRIGHCKEITNLGATIQDPTTYEFQDERITRIAYDYASTFYEFMMSGGTGAMEAFKDYPFAVPFISPPKSDAVPSNFNTLYGPRIANQLPDVVKELKDHPNTRRATILILNENDRVLYDADETLEYPCTVSMIYQIRDGKLNGQVNMRSQNTAIVMQLDFYLQCRALCDIAKLVGVPVGKMSFNYASAHIFDRDYDYVRGFLSNE